MMKVLRGGILCLVIAGVASALCVTAEVTGYDVSNNEPDVCVHHKVTVTLKRSDVNGNPGVTQVSVHIENRDYDWPDADDCIGTHANSPYTVDVSACVGAMGLDPNISECSTCKNITEKWPATPTGVATGENCIEWYIRVHATFGSETAFHSSEVTEVKLSE